MNRYSILSMAAVLLAVSSAAGAAESTKDEAYAARLFAGEIGKDKSYACFVRRYDAAHLARHPQQKVETMKLLVSAEKVPEAEGLSYSFRLGIEFRDRRGTFESAGSCGHVGDFDEAADKLHLGCGVDCDGGGISVELANDDKATLVRIEELRIWRSGNAGDDEEDIALKGGADDRSFRLDRADLKDCGALMPEPEEHSAMLQD